MSEHARLSCSDKSWPHCPGSPRENAAYPDIPGQAAIDGTGSHLLLELCMKQGVRADTYDMQLIGMNHPEMPGGWMVDLERCRRVQMCLDYVSTRAKELKGIYPGCKITVESESKSYPGALVGRTDWWGTCDITITVTNDHGYAVYLEVIDYKDGREYVYARDNTQLQSYLFGKMRPFIENDTGPLQWHRVNETRQTIVQPKTNPPVRYHDAPALELVDAFNFLWAAAFATDDPNAPLIPDDKGGKGHCRWCSHGRAKNCAALNNKTLDSANMGQELVATGGSAAIFELTTVADIQSMSDEALAKLYDREAPVMQVFNHIREELQRRVEERGVNGFAMEPGKNSKVWAFKESEIVEALKSKRFKMSEIYPTSLISPAQALKMDRLTPIQKKHLESELIVTKASDTKKLTRVKYERQQLSVEQMFGNRNVIASDKPKPPNFLNPPPKRPSFL